MIRYIVVQHLILYAVILYLAKLSFCTILFTFAVNFYFQFITCYEDVEKYRLSKAFRAETKTAFELLCQQIVSSSKNNMGVER